MPPPHRNVFGAQGNINNGFKDKINAREQIVVRVLGILEYWRQKYCEC